MIHILDDNGNIHTSYRAEVLALAANCVLQDRNNQYGPPDADFQRIAKLWTILFDRQFTSHEVALAMICLKLSRITWDRSNQDSWVDIAGYAACGYECTELVLDE